MMAKPKSAKVFIKNGSDIKAFMWATVGSDGSVMMGMPWESKEAIALVMDEELGNLKQEDLETEGYTGKSKISFHKSGNYKFNCRMGKTEEAIDRVTVTGKPFDQITSPYRLAEMLLPEKLPDSGYSPSERDIIINVTDADSSPTRCTIFCVGNKEFEEITKKDIKLVNTSIWEASSALETDTHKWIWTLRKSKNDLSYADKVYVTLLGSPKWGVE
jgi:hypothetical protein